MKNCIVLGAVGVMAGVVSSVFGQFATMEMVASGVWDGDNRMTLSVFVDSEYSEPGFDVTHILDAQFTLEAIGENSTVEQISLLEGPGWQNEVNLIDEGYDGAGGYAGFSITQFWFLPFIQPDEASSLADGPVFVASFEVILSEAITSETELGWQFGGYFADPQYPHILKIFDIFANPNGTANGGEAISLSESLIDLGSFYIPSPSGLVVLLGAACFGARRRRL